MTDYIINPNISNTTYNNGTTIDSTIGETTKSITQGTIGSPTKQLIRQL